MAARFPPSWKSSACIIQPHRAQGPGPTHCYLPLLEAFGDGVASSRAPKNILVGGLFGPTPKVGVVDEVVDGCVTVVRVFVKNLRDLVEPAPLLPTRLPTTFVTPALYSSGTKQARRTFGAMLLRRAIVYGRSARAAGGVISGRGRSASFAVRTGASYDRNCSCKQTGLNRSAAFSAHTIYSTGQRTSKPSVVVSFNRSLHAAAVALVAERMISSILLC